MARLPLGEVNVVIVTDVHSWVAGHGRHEPELDADYGDVLSFYERLSKYCQNSGHALFFVMNGDFTDGTGLSTTPPEYLTPILEKMPWDAINIGNHELYHNETIEFLTAPGGFIEAKDGRYLTSNVLLSQTGKPLGGRYRFLRSDNGASETTVLAFGFLFDFTNNTPITTVEVVENVVKSDWFIDVLSGKDGDFDAILVLAHMDVKHSLISTILAAIRNTCGSDMPVQFVTGHTHYRSQSFPDPMSSSVEAGRYLDTVGFVSFPTQSTLQQTLSATPNNDKNLTMELFKHQFINANVHTLQHTLGVDQLNTPNGSSLSNFIHDTQISMDLLDIVGCSPKTYNRNKALTDSHSLWGLYANIIVPQTFFRGRTDMVMINSVGSLRYDLFRGNITVTDLLSVDPFNDTIYRIGDDDVLIRGSDILAAFGPPNQVRGEVSYAPDLPSFIFSGQIHEEQQYELYTTFFLSDRISASMHKTTGQTYKTAPYLNPNNDRVVTSTSLWFQYVGSSEWGGPCPPDARTGFFDSVGYGGGNRNTQVFLAAFGMICTFLVLCLLGLKMGCCLFYQKPRKYELPELSVSDVDDMSSFNTIATPIT